MYRFNMSCYTVLSESLANLNTTHVSVQYTTNGVPTFAEADLNTTHVSVQLKVRTCLSPSLKKFKYNPCIGSIKSYRFL